MVPVVPPSNTEGSLVNLQTSAKIDGDETQVATITLQPGQSIRAESGSMVFMTSSIEMETSSSMGDGMKRFMTGQALFVTDFTAVDKPGEVALATAFPSKILRLNLQEYGELVCQKGAYIASNVGVDIELAFTKSFSAGFFGGEGFVLQKLTGQGDVLLQASGALVRKELEEGQTLRVSSGALVCFTNTIDYDVQMMPGIKNAMFGGEGLFVTTLKGPGTVWLQGMPPDRMISEIAKRVPGGGMGFGVPIGMGAGGGGEATEGGAEGAADEAAGGEGGSEDMVASSDAAIDADRQATVATSGAMGDDGGSSGSLFGDAAPKEDPSSSQPQDNIFGGDSMTQESTFGGDSDGFDQGFGEETTFSDESFNDFTDDETSFSSFGEESSSGLGDSLGDSMDVGDVDTGGIAETAKNVFSTLWDFFTGDD
jgi:uncharacterized protein (TIGR00266 family)